MRLIDEDYLIKNGYRVCSIKNGLFVLNNLIDEIPTAFDKEKVIEQLIELNKIATTEPYCDMIDKKYEGKGCKEINCFQCLMREVIDIVEKGGNEE